MSSIKLTGSCFRFVLGCRSSLLQYAARSCCFGQMCVLQRPFGPSLSVNLETERSSA
jgi:hypothetical protein